MIANAVTLVRMSFTLPLFLLLALGEGQGRWIALALFLGAGALDIVDGRLARSLGQSSEFGAMLDLLGDRLLTLAALTGLMAAGTWSSGDRIDGLALCAALVLAARCMVVASLKEPLGAALAMPVNPPEWAKIALAFTGASLLIAPPFLPLDQAMLGDVLLIAAAALTVIIVAGYWTRALALFAQQEAAGAGRRGRSAPARKS